MREMVEREVMGQPMVSRRRAAVARRPHGTGLEYGLIAAALAVAIVTVVVGVGTRYGAVPTPAPALSLDAALR